MPIRSERLLERFLDLCRIDSVHPHESRLAEVLRPPLEAAGMRFRQDPSGNLLGRMPARGRSGPPVLLSAHMDTVSSTTGLAPVVRDGAVWSDGRTILGADDKAALAAIVEAVMAVEEAGVERGPVEVLFTVAEEIGHLGAQAFDLSWVESPMAFVLDAGAPVGDVILAAPGQRAITAVFHGRAAHAGIEPERGASAVVMAAHAVTAMPLGRIDPETTANLGRLRGGQANNIVAPRAELDAEARSRDPAKLERQVQAMVEACRAGARAGGGQVEVTARTTYEGYRFGPDQPIVLRARRGLRAVGIEPRLTTTGGGSDANQFNHRGLPALVLGTGYRNAHSVQESMPLGELRQLSQLCAALMTGA